MIKMVTIIFIMMQFHNLSTLVLSEFLHSFHQISRNYTWMSIKLYIGVCPFLLDFFHSILSSKWSFLSVFWSSFLIYVCLCISTFLLVFTIFMLLNIKSKGRLILERFSSRKIDTRCFQWNYSIRITWLIYKLFAFFLVYYNFPENNLTQVITV